MRPIATLAVAVCVLLLAGCQDPPPATTPPATEASTAAPPRLYWFVPDGLRADPDQFRIFEWAEAGELPHIKRMMDRGAYGYSIPDFPSHTPVNFASLLTGVHPDRHGIADGPMHTVGAPLAQPSLSGFASTAKRTPPVWKALEDAGRRVALVSLPGSTPPELKQGVTLRGRWGNWGADTPAVIFEPRSLMAQRGRAAQAYRLFYRGSRLTDFVDLIPASGWRDVPASFSAPLEAALTAYGLTVHAHIADTTDDRRTNYDTVTLSLDKLAPMERLVAGRNGAWHRVTLSWKDQSFPSDVRPRLIKLWPESGAFRLRLFFNNLNRFAAVPPEVAGEITLAAGPMVDFPDNWPAQLVTEPEDRETFRDEAFDALDWHRRAARHLIVNEKPDVLIHDTYTPNQMLEARWWMPEIDPARRDRDPARELAAWKDIKELYRRIDAILGEAMAAAPADTVFALSSDHGIVPLRRQVCLNNLFAERGWLSYTIDPQTGDPIIDWKKSRVVYLKMAYVYINPDGLAGPWDHGTGPAYEALRREVVAALAGLADEDGQAPLVRAVPWEAATSELRLPPDRIGDLVLVARPGFQWREEISADDRVFVAPLEGGYKQAVDPLTTREVWTPFVIMGPGVRPAGRLADPISHVDQVPTLLRLLGITVPAHVQGRVLAEILLPEKTR